MDNKSFTSSDMENLVPEGFVPQSQNLSENSSKLKKCPFCAELIQPEAIKCRYCGEFLHGFSPKDVRPQTKKWYHTTYGLIILFLIAGPLAFFLLPVIWKNPHTSRAYKIVITIITLAYTAFFVFISIAIVKLGMKIVNEQMQQLETLGI